jgi:hypothetical protein
MWAGCGCANVSLHVASHFLVRPALDAVPFGGGLGGAGAGRVEAAIKRPHFALGVGDCFATAIDGSDCRRPQTTDFTDWFDQAGSGDPVSGPNHIPPWVLRRHRTMIARADDPYT